MPSAQPVPGVTWAALKRTIEATGVTDETVVSYLDFALFWGKSVVRVRLRRLADGSVEVLFEG